MKPDQSRFLVTWAQPAGHTVSIPSGHVVIAVATGLQMKVAFRSTDQSPLSVDLALDGASLSRSGACDVRSRFVVIPLDGRALLIGVAEQSDEPTFLMPTAATATWAGTDGLPATQEGSVIARSSAGDELTIRFESPGPLRDACVIRISLDGRDGAGLSIVRVTPEALRLEVRSGT